MNIALIFVYIVDNEYIPNTFGNEMHISTALSWRGYESHIEQMVKECNTFEDLVCQYTFEWHKDSDQAITILRQDYSRYLVNRMVKLVE